MVHPARVDGLGLIQNEKINRLALDLLGVRVGSAGAFVDARRSPHAQHRLGQKQPHAGFCGVGCPRTLGLSGANGAVADGTAGLWRTVEVLQSFTPDRFAEWADVLADAVGLLVGAGLASQLRRFS